MCLLLAFAFKETVFWGAEYYGRNVRLVDVAGFRRYGSARKLYNFHIDHAGSY